MKVQYWKSAKDGQWYWHLVARNGEVMLSSEGYTRRISATRSIERFLTEAANAAVELVKE